MGQTYLQLAVFNGAGSAEKAIDRIPHRDPRRVAAVVVVKDPEGELSVRDVGLTPRKGAVSGAVLGGAVGLLTGGAGLALVAVGGLVGHRLAHKRRVEEVAPTPIDRVAASLGPDSSAIVAVNRHPIKPETLDRLEELGASVFETAIDPETAAGIEEGADEAYAAMLAALAETTGGEAVTSVPYPRIHVIVNPVSGKDEPIVNVLNRTFYEYGIDWDMSITRAYGDATAFARQAAKDGYDLVAGYGGDGTQHEVANGIMGTSAVLGVLPGGTGNGFSNELGLPGDLPTAVKLLCTSHNQRRVDVAQVGDDYFVQRLFTGIEPEEQTSRADKDKYGTLAYLKRDIGRLRNERDVPYHLTVDGETIEVMGHKCYIVNSAKAGTGLSIARRFAVDDGVLDVFMLSRDKASTSGAINRFLDLDNETSGAYYWRGERITIDADPDQPVWTDGEYTGRTPVTAQVLPGALTVAVR